MTVRYLFNPIVGSRSLSRAFFLAVFLIASHYTIEWIDPLFGWVFCLLTFSSTCYSRRPFVLLYVLCFMRREEQHLTVGLCAWCKRRFRFVKTKSMSSLWIRYWNITQIHYNLLYRCRGASMHLKLVIEMGLLFRWTYDTACLWSVSHWAASFHTCTRLCFRHRIETRTNSDGGACFVQLPLSCWIYDVPFLCL